MSVNILLLSLLACLFFFFVRLPFLFRHDLRRISEDQLTMFSASYLCAFVSNKLLDYFVLFSETAYAVKSYISAVPSSIHRIIIFENGEVSL